MNKVVLMKMQMPVLISATSGIARSAEISHSSKVDEYNTEVAITVRRSY